MDQIINEASQMLGAEMADDGEGAEAEEGTRDQASEPVDLLLRDYYAKVGSSEKLNDGIARLAGTALPIVFTLLGFLAANRSLPPEVYWLVPLAMVLLVGVLMQQVYRAVLIGYYLRDLEERIRVLTGATPFFYENLTNRALYSPRTGTPAFLALYGMYFAIIATAYFGLIVYCLRGLLITPSVPNGVIVSYIAFYATITAVMIWAMLFYLSGMRTLYRKWADRLAVQAIVAIEGRPRGLLRYIVLPRPFDFIVKTPITVANALLAADVLRTSLRHDWPLLIGVLVCVEFFAKQATYIWNDLLDAEADRAHEHKKRRYLATVEGGALGGRLLVVRALCAFGIAAALAVAAHLPLLPPLVAAIFFVQFLYDRYAKPVPPARLVLAALAYVERAVAGAAVAVAAARTGPHVALFVVLAAWTVGFALLFLAASWRAEDDFRLRTDGAAYLARGGRTWFLRYGTRVEVAASLLLVPLGLAVSLLRANTLHARAAVALVVAGLVGVAGAWLLLTRVRVREGDAVGAVVVPNGRAPDRPTAYRAPEWARYALYALLAILWAVCFFVFRGVPRFPFVMVFLFPVGAAAVYAYATYEELNFLNVKPTLVFAAHFLNQLIFTKKRVRAILRDLHAAAHPDPAPEP